MALDKLPASSLETSQFSFRNKLINGNFLICQRGTAVTPGGSAYTLDQWKAAGAAGSVVSRVADHPSGYGYCAQFLNTGGSDWHMNRIEAENCKHLVGKSVTLSFWVKNVSGLTGMAAAIDYASTADNFTSYTAIGSIASLTATASWVKHTLTVVIPAGAVNGLQVRIVNCTAAGASVNKVADVQLEEGSFATPFENRPIQVELVMCQRYFETGVAYYEGYVPGASSPVGGIGSYFCVTKRVTPSVTYGSFTNIQNALIGGTRSVDIFGIRRYALGNSAAAAVITATESWFASAEL